MRFATIHSYLCWNDKSLTVGLFRSVGIGVVSAALLMLFSSLLFALLGRANMGELAAKAVFERGWIATCFAAIIWAPLWETLIAQLIPFSLLRWFGAPRSIAVFGSAALFSAGHMASGGGIGQGMVTFVGGLLFASLFAANGDAGLGRASLFTATAHVTNNALLVLLSFGFDF